MQRYQAGWPAARIAEQLGVARSTGSLGSVRSRHLAPTVGG
ncbi:hypothetical protein [Amycolatopsis sp. 3B14]